MDELNRKRHAIRELIRRKLDEDEAVTNMEVEAKAAEDKAKVVEDGKGHQEEATTEESKETMLVRQYSSAPFDGMIVLTITREVFW